MDARQDEELPEMDSFQLQTSIDRLQTVVEQESWTDR